MPDATILAGASAVPSSDVPGHQHTYAFLRQEPAGADKALDVFFCRICLEYTSRGVWIGRK